MKEYTQLLKHSQFSAVAETAEGAQEHRFHIGPISILLFPRVLPPNKKTFKRHFSKVQILKMLYMFPSGWKRDAFSPVVP